MADKRKSTRGAARHRAGGATGRRKALLIGIWSLAGLLVLGGTGLGYLYFRLNGNLDGVNINGALGRDRPQNVDNGSMDILVLGSDSRAGKNRAYGKDEGASRSDTAMVVHVYQGRKRATVVSIPRDTLVARPQCAKDGKQVPAVDRAMFNTAYEVGGPACAVKTVESMTGIRMDHYLEVDFTGFKNLVDKLGGVELTTTEPIHDPQSHLDLAAGRHTLDGEQSLGLVRTRHGVGDGSDLGRIKLQQAFVKALIDQMENVDVFSSPKKLFDLADVSTKALTTDSELASVDRLLGFARDLKGIDSRHVDMVTLPVRYDPANPNRVIPVESRARQVWQALHDDRPVPKAATKGSAGDETAAGGVIRSSRGHAGSERAPS
ncbi:LCP family protein [Streptomyces palmae]|uniref:LytR family transcriptional regulator n=1 Tax=Streptomyces palmae TaxID=1701085 RepID=A0A4Z0HD10_9ACTN|nr:LCP family protein [Streptomyces palmae]TGB09905.1 LytR family transcriptional regulator [Streptomyces palmae]